MQATWPDSVARCDESLGEATERMAGVPQVAWGSIRALRDDFESEWVRTEGGVLIRTLPSVTTLAQAQHWLQLS